MMNGMQSDEQTVIYLAKHALFHRFQKLSEAVSINLPLYI